MPSIQFCSAHDGKRIAYATDGEGPAIVLPAWWISHVQKDWEYERFREFFSALAQRHFVVRYDRIGAGLSDREREVTDVTVEREVADLTRVIDHLGFDQVILFGVSCGGPTAVTYAVRNPDRVRALIFYGSYLRGATVGSTAVQEAVAALVRASWGLGSKTLASIFTPDLGPEQVRRASAQQRAWADGEMAAQLLKLTYVGDVAALAREISVPSLVMHRQRDHAVPFAAGRELAAGLPNATLVPLEGSAHVPWEGDTRPVLEAISQFLGGEPEPSTGPADLPDVENALVRSGDVWLLSFAGTQAHFKHSKGLADLAILLSQPGKEVPAVVLMGSLAAEAPPSGSAEVLDRRARAEFRRRIQTIDEELEEAQSFHDLGRIERLQGERDAILRELTTATGLGGRARKLKDPAERARKAVSARVHESIQRIADAHPAAGRHLSAAVRTGAFCCYEPGTPMNWSL